MSAVDFFLKIDGIEGESQDAKHKGELQLLSFSHGVVHQPGAGSAGGSGDAGLSTWPDASFTMHIDKAYPKLFTACCSGEHIKKSVLIMRKAGKVQQDFLKITYSDVLVSSVSTQGTSAKPGASLPIVNFSFNFAQIEEEYRTQKEDGSLSGAIKYTYSIPKAAKGP